ARAGLVADAPCVIPPGRDLDPSRSRVAWLSRSGRTGTARAPCPRAGPCALFPLRTGLVHGDADHLAARTRRARQPDSQRAIRQIAANPVLGFAAHLEISDSQRCGRGLRLARSAHATFTSRGVTCMPPARSPPNRRLCLPGCGSAVEPAYLAVNLHSDARQI